MKDIFCKDINIGDLVLFHIHEQSIFKRGIVVKKDPTTCKVLFMRHDGTIDVYRSCQNYQNIFKYDWKSEKEFCELECSSLELFITLNSYIKEHGLP